MKLNINLDELDLIWEESLTKYIKECVQDEIRKSVSKQIKDDANIKKAIAILIRRASERIVRDETEKNKND